MALSIISLVIAIVALSVNLAGLVRRPRIVAEWGFVNDNPPHEGIAIIATARRRTIEVDEVGLVMLPEHARRRWQVPEWLHQERPHRLKLEAGELPQRLEDGQSIRAFAELDFAIEALDGYAGKAVPYVMASGIVYLGRDSNLAARWRRRVGED
jgi:hypothetical protein